MNIDTTVFITYLKATYDTRTNYENYDVTKHYGGVHEQLRNVKKLAPLLCRTKK